MTNVDPLDSARYELKFNSKSSQYNHLQSWLSCHPAVFSPIFEPRTINNIYFDNYDLDAFFENLTGISSRAKLRLRWYGETFDPEHATLELKLRRNLLGWKIANKVSFKNKKLSQMHWKELTDHIVSKVPYDLSLHFTTSPLAVLMNRYKRDYYMEANNRVRITIDKDIQYFDQRSGVKMNKSFENICPDMIVMELKAAANDIEAAQKITKDIYIQRTKNSKYVVGVSSILGY